MPATPTTPKGRRTREHIVARSRQVFARSGYVGATMSAVATEADISLGGLYRYFNNKEDLFESLVTDIHEELYSASGATTHDFRSSPYEALLEANAGYLRHYYEHRDVMRALIEAATVEDRFRDVWWRMRTRHIERFTESLRTEHGIAKIEGQPVRLAAESAACMVEQSAYVWYAHEDLHDTTVTIDEAARIVTRAWYGLFFGSEAPES